MANLGSHLAGSDGHVLVVHLPARFTDEWINHIRREVETRLPPIPGAGLVLDFGCVEIINSLGITCLLNLDERCRLAGAGMVLACVSPTTMGFLSRVKLDKKFKISPMVEEAVARFTLG